MTSTDDTHFQEIKVHCRKLCCSFNGQTVKAKSSGRLLAVVCTSKYLYKLNLRL